MGRVGFAGGGFHHLPDEKAEDFLFAVSVLRGLFRVVGHHLRDDRFDFAAVGQLFEPFGGDDVVHFAFALPHRGEHFFGDFAGDGVVGDAP